MPPNCTQRTVSRKIALGEKGSAYKAYIINASTVDHDVVRFDGCVVQNEEAADWIVRKIGVGSVIVEIKGADVSKALKQLVATYNHMHARPHIEEKCGFLIICSRMPQMDTSIQRAMVKIRALGKLKVACRGGEFAVENLI